MLKTTLPTWISRAPRNFGCASHGKLKADQWRTACMINLVITFCRLWGKPGASKRETEILQNFLSLIIAERIAIVKEYFKFYLKSAVSIFSEACLVTNNHLSLHIAECLWRFGPAHGWWAFPFKRYNGIIQHYKTNCEVELTFIHTFCWGGNLKVLMASDNLPEVLGSFRLIIQSYFGKDFRGNILCDLLALAPKNHNLDHKGSDIPWMDNLPLISLSNEHLNRDDPALRYCSFTDPFDACTRSLEPKAQFRKSLRKRGVVYSAASQHVGNSFIFFHHCGSSIAGQIQEIFVHTRAINEHPMTEPNWHKSGAVCASTIPSTGTWN
ncbi:hypothetical protein SCLCIDRAFT_16469 [Scleroderma citrinum Foug A]|uniref:DUF4218 domain-containing protein n=1 Tax=Scleroderma citrinum Foug A TaxID=1036808 RepID=A0A0C3DU02_9AGAM|nr:hypothetical protein SCLCIDRAFT_16469 [Scleroderma citrinum Foug A]